ncbi:ATP-dependent helicase SGS1, partial [Paramuricea clavata]
YSTYTGDDDSITESYIHQLYNLSKTAEFTDCSPLPSKSSTKLLTLEALGIYVQQEKYFEEMAKIKGALGKQILQIIFCPQKTLINMLQERWEFGLLLKLCKSYCRLNIEFGLVKNLKTAQKRLGRNNVCDRHSHSLRKKLTLEDEQKEAVKSFLSGRDVLAILPTGFGKSLIFQLFATAKSIVVLVICPLDGIVKGKLTEAESYGLKAVSLSSSDMFEQMNDAPNVVFASAEAVSQKAFRESLKRTRHIHAIVIDESHTVETWTGK